MIRSTLRINKFNIQIEHRPGLSNTVTHRLSRAPRPEKENQKKEIKSSLIATWVAISVPHLIWEQ